jgi:hypothetical protein
MFAETRWGLAKSMYPRLLGIAAVVFGFGLSEALPAGDVWKAPGNSRSTARISRL